MFRKARIQTLARKVQKYMKGAPSKTQAGFNQEDTEDWSKYLNAFSQFIIKYLDETQLKTLLKSLENKGGIHTDCILLPRESEALKKTGLTSDVLICKVLRWPDVSSLNQLKTFVNCRNRDVSSPCGNPFHYSKITRGGKRKCSEETTNKDGMDNKSEKAGSARFSDDGFSEQEEEEPINYEDNDKTIAGCSDSRLSSGFQTRQNSDVTSSTTYEPWCSIAYWEVKRRIGRIFDVTTDCVNVFYELPQGDGMCIGLLDHVERSAYVSKVRKHIGYGFQLTQEHDGIWIYNRSDYCIFVSAPALDAEVLPMVVKPEVIRVAPGHCVHAVDFRRPLSLISRSRKFDHSIDVFCIRVSFAKGWGENYTRQYITACPCWTEIYLREPFLALMGLI